MNIISELCEDFLGRVVLVLIVCAILALCVGIFCSIDNSLGTTKEVSGTVINKIYHPPWVQVVSTGKTTTVINHPARYDVVLDTVEGNITASVSEEQYNILINSDKVLASETFGKFTGNRTSASVIRRQE